MKINGCKHHSECMDVRFDALDMMLNHTNEWYVIVDAVGTIIAISQAYKEFIGAENPEGRFVGDVIENTRMHLVLETGVPEYDQVQVIRGNKMIASRVPLIVDGKVRGAIGKATFKDIDDLYTLYNRVKKNHKEISVYVELGKGVNRPKYTFEHISGAGCTTKCTKELAKKAAKSESNVLIVGPSGTGKELYAHAIHGASHRSKGPMVMVNCAAIPENLLESELFGYVKGAFTGASQSGKKGRFELAHRGTLFLDEIGDMPLDMQAKLLRVIQSKEVDPVGGEVPIEVDVRIIAATNRNVEQLVQRGKFREDLYYRLNVMRIDLAPLKKRKEEIPQIAKDVLMKLSQQMDVVVHGFTPDALSALMDYDWPGNIRELENVLERAINLMEEDLYIDACALPEHMENRAEKKDVQNLKLESMTDITEKEFIKRALIRTKGNKKQAAMELGISRAGFYNKLKKHGF
ncbi:MULTISPECIES: sigma-54-dependent Fis family transcriptional regulator [unclassified Fusibacter]|uniref:sigma-54 interaction domain-containing protein n=1 Tax=unclassified Fusibacter TaxID=2624464 RepID=UPI001010CF6F|nr:MULTISPECIES: sigma 54-interacting transcriptional regulator [unclassified Fusibacter]MCK8058667.1 sigma 54-interacting transcriptional regulator [Fusibacter sp. A2]NPE21742.1 sigma 54-interacting transcriptional regulator [Fusibacter sp. A1]RXV61316.1 AAA family ATPase [Fusibacter sp. A1]